ncbi:cell wall metabolism sensor histidine kinase WalK [Pleurocapsa sp. PCC 7319]|uniref:sensor histidine kinase n=1 Tax=Pleurocapsa sp. PCC 7319 TaxID=118161 RepID=UPI001ED98BAE|nr:HAMP domain-containing sensor histidine kinase [Pleurocapsa sp. PCC 7319]
MSLITISVQLLRRGFPLPPRRLIIIYLTVAISIISISEIFLYFFIIRNLDQESNQELLSLVEIAAPSLGIVKTEGLENIEKQLSWRELFAEHKQSLEWFDSQGRLLAREGQNFLEAPLKTTISEQVKSEDFPLFKRQGQVRTVTIAMYGDSQQNQTVVLEGYIRASESTEEMDQIRNNLQLGLALGGSLALILISMSSIYLTQQAIMPVKQGFRKLKQMTTDVSHQLRTPLTRISMATEILLTHTDKIQPSDTRKLKIINDAVEQLRSLIEDLLFLIRLDLTANLEELQFSDVSLNLLLQNLRGKYQITAAKKSIDFQVRIEQKLTVKGNSNKLTKVLNNLLENAFEYTEAGGKVVVLGKLRGEEVIISIRDTGMGISPEELPHIYQYFWRGEAAKLKVAEGSGLGLTIARAVIEQHGGQLEVTSQLGKGSYVLVCLPSV